MLRILFILNIGLLSAYCYGQKPDLKTWFNTGFDRYYDPEMDFNQKWLVLVHDTLQNTAFLVKLMDVRTGEELFERTVPLPLQWIDSRLAICDVALVNEKIVVLIFDYLIVVPMDENDQVEYIILDDNFFSIDLFVADQVLLSRISTSEAQNRVAIEIFDLESKKTMSRYARHRHEGIGFSHKRGVKWMAVGGDRIFIIKPLTYHIIELDEHLLPVDSFGYQGYGNQKLIEIHDNLPMEPNAAFARIMGLDPYDCKMEHIFRFQASGPDTLFVYRFKRRHNNKRPVMIVDRWIRVQGHWQMDEALYTDKKPRPYTWIRKSAFLQESYYSTKIKRHGKHLGILDLRPDKPYGRPFGVMNMRMRLSKPKQHSFLLLEDD
jgi:hypothetical protein